MGATESILYDEAVVPTEAHPRPVAVEPPMRPRPIPGEPIRSIPQQQPQKIPRKRPPQQAKPIKRMEGLVLGGPKTGKRTLLSRLKGVDPFATERDGMEEANPSITIQYKPPSDSPTWDRIKLRIRYAQDMADDKSTTSGQIDFVVLLISPKNSQEMTQSYLEGVLGMYLDRLGYQNDNGENENLTKPFCMAVLFNFRDLQVGRNKEKDSETSRAQLKRIVETTLRSRNVEENKVVVELLETSLLNCYGLDGLHRFIYRTYLQRCQMDIERQLSVVRKQIQLTDVRNSQADDTTDSVKTKGYDEFLKEITPQEEVVPPQDQAQEETDSPPVVRMPQTTQEPVRRKMNFQPPKKQEQELRMGRDALEAFLASSSDEEDDTPPISRRKMLPKTGYASSSSSSDDESDDDFFYDESGNRRHQIQNSRPRMIAQDIDDRKQVMDSDSNDSSSSDDPVHKVSSQPVETQSKQTPQQKSIDTERKSTEEIKEVSENVEVQEVIATEETTTELENESLDEEHANASSTSSRNLDEDDEIIERSPTEEAINGSNMVVDNNGEEDIGEVDNRSHKSETLSNDDNEAESLNYMSSDEAHEEVHDSEKENVGDVDDSDVSPAHSNQSDDDHDDSMIDPKPAATNSDEAIEDDVDNGDYMIQSTPEEIPKEDSDDEDDDYMIGSTPAIENVAEDDDDSDDGYVIHSTPNDKNTNEDDSDDDGGIGFMIGSTSAENVAEDDDDDFIIGQTSVNEGSAMQDEDSDSDFVIQSNPIGNDDNNNADDSLVAQSPTRPLTKTPESETNAVQSTPTPASSGGISQAALAAIAAAQQEAEAMMRQQQYSQIPSDMKEKKSKKKKKDDKKKKKKKKSKEVDGS